MRPSVMHAATVMARALWVRFHVALILFIVVVAGVLANTVLLHLGLPSLAVRYTLAVLFGYATFFVGIKLWLWYADTALPPRLKHDIAQVEAGQMKPEQSNLRTETQWRELLDFGAPDLPDGDGCLGAVVAFLLGILLLVVLGIGAYLLAEAPVMLGEVFVQAALAGALRRGAKRMAEPHWSGAVLRATWFPAAIVLILAVLLGYLVQRHCPGAARLGEALLHCRRR